MSDITIPGFSNQNSAIDTQKIIEDLVELERIPINRLEDTISQYELERQIWLDLGQSIRQLSDNASLLFSFQNPFRERIGTSSDDSAVRVTATRGTEESSHTLEIVNTAQRDRFASQALPKKFLLEAGRYSFSVGDEEITLSFKGGDLTAFVKSLNAIKPDFLTARVVPHTQESAIIVFDAQQYGIENRLGFKDDALPFALEHGIITPNSAEAVAYPELQTVTAQEQIKIPFDNPLEITANTTLTFQAHVERVSPNTAGGFSLRSSGAITLEGVTVPNIASSVPLANAQVETVDNTHPTYLYAQTTDGSEVALADITETADFTDFRIALDAITQPIQALIIRNDNTHQRLAIKEIAISNEQFGEYLPTNPIEVAQNAELIYDGVRVSRPTNTITDLLADVTFDIRSASSAPIDIAITPDYENVKNTVINFVGSYNQLIREVNVITRRDSQIIDELEFLSDEERQSAQERLGALQGEITLNQLRNRLINITQNAYPTHAGQAVNLLAQIGIATNLSNRGGGVNLSRLRGYLELDESEFDNALQTNFQAIQELFGNDTDNDLVVDSGVAYEIDRYSDLYIGAGGTIQIRTGGLDNRIEDGTATVTTYNERLEDYEQKLRDDFGRMQGALNSLDDTTRSLENLGTSQ